MITPLYGTAFAKAHQKQNTNEEVPDVSKPVLGSFKIPKVKPKLKNDTNSLDVRGGEERKKTRKEMKSDVLKGAEVSARAKKNVPGSITTGTTRDKKNKWKYEHDDQGSSKKKVKRLVAESSSSAKQLASYTMSLMVLDKLGPRSLFDSHCHMDFILFWKAPQVELESFDQFVNTYPLMDHSSMEGFITNFCCPSLWLQHLPFPTTPLIQSLLSRPSVFYTLGCH